MSQINTTFDIILIFLPYVPDLWITYLISHDLFQMHKFFSDDLMIFVSLPKSPRKACFSHLGKKRTKNYESSADYEHVRTITENY